MLNAHALANKHIMNKFASKMKQKSRKNPKSNILGTTLLLSIVLASFSVIICKLLHFNKQLEVLASTDSLTHLYNQRSLTKVLDQELERAQRYHRTFAVLFLDIDYFKLINDTYNHSVGNAVLSEFARVVRSLLRRNDTLGRWGGDEFLVILPDTGETGAQQVIERIHATLENHLFISGSEFHLTCSVGFATFPFTSQVGELLINAADQAMFAAKCQAHKHKYSAPALHVLEPESARFSQKILEVAII